MGKTIYYKDNTLSFTARSSAENTFFVAESAVLGFRITSIFSRRRKIRQISLK